MTTYSVNRACSREHHFSGELGRRWSDGSERNGQGTVETSMSSDAQGRDVRLPDDPIAIAVVPQMATPRNVSDDQDVSLRLLCRYKGASLNGCRARFWREALGTMPHDWQARYGHHPLLLETLVDTKRFRGICYRAANWIPRRAGRWARAHGPGTPTTRSSHQRHLRVSPARQRLCGDPAR
jgi:hypothetical protein